MALKQGTGCTLFASVLILTTWAASTCWHPSTLLTRSGYSWANEVDAVDRRRRARGAHGRLVFGGARRLTDVTGLLVPVMAIIYLGVSFVVIVLATRTFPRLFAAIFRSAFDFRLSSAVSPAFGRPMLGIKRGLLERLARFGSNAAASAFRVTPRQAGPRRNAVRLHRHDGDLHAHRFRGALLESVRISGVTGAPS